MASRTKSQVTDVTWGAGRYALFNVSTGARANSWTYQSQGSHQDFETITWEVGKRRDRTKNCVHEVYHLSLPACLTGCRYHSGTQDLCHEGSRGNDWFTVSTGSMSALVPSVSDIASFNAEAFAAMAPSFETDLQLTNSLLELLELGLILKLVSRWGKFAKNLRKSLKRLRRTGHRRVAKQTARELAEAHLTWAFGIKPFVSDCLQVYNVITTFSDSIAEFMAKRNTPQVRHYTKTRVEDSGVTEYPSTQAQRTAFWSKSCKLYATMHYTYDCEDLTTMSAQFKVLRDMLGLRFGWAQVWEAIPFSFVVDWFIRVGDVFERYQQPLIRPTITVTDYCVSYKAERRVTTKYHLLGGRVQSHSPVKAGDLEHTKYVRSRQLPDTGGTFINPGRFGPNQLALSASLLTVLSSRR